MIDVMKSEPMQQLAQHHGAVIGNLYVVTYMLAGMSKRDRKDISKKYGFNLEGVIQSNLTLLAPDDARRIRDLLKQPDKRNI